MLEPDPPADLDHLLRHSEWVRGLALRLCADAHGADDAVQETWLAALRSPPRAGRDRGWLATTLRNALRLRRRSDQRRAARERNVEVDEVAESAASAAARAELHRRLVDLVLALPEPQRALVLLHYFEAQDVATLARSHGLSADAVRAHLRRARATLRAELERDPRQRRTLHGLLPAAAFPLKETMAGTLTAMTAMKVQLTIAAGFAVAVAALWVAWPTGTVAPATVHQRPEPPLAMRGTASITGEGASDVNAGAAPERREQPAAPAAPPLRIRLRGVHPAARWTAALNLDLEGTDASGTRHFEHEGTATPTVEGTAVLLLPDWHATASRLKARIDSDDPNYLPLDWRRDGRLDLGEELVLDIQVVARLDGRVVDPEGAPVPAARVAAFAIADDEPLDRRLATTNTRADGTYTLRAPPDVPLLVLAVPLQEARISGRLVMMDGTIPDAGMFRTDLLPAATRSRGTVGTPTAVPDLVLPRPARVTGVVRWPDGQQVPGVVVRALPNGDRTLDLGGSVAVQTQPGDRLGSFAIVDTDREGRFALPGTPGVALDVEVTQVQDVVVLGALPMVRAIPPQHVEVTLPRPLHLHVTRAGAPVPGAAIEVEHERPFPTDASGRRSVLHDGRPRRVRALHDSARSPWYEFADADRDQRLVLELGERVASLLVDFEGDYRVRNATFTLRRLPDGPATTERLVRDDRSGPFRLGIEPGRWLLSAGPAPGERNGLWLLPVEREIDVGPAGLQVTLAARFGGSFTVVATDAAGLHVAGTARLRDAGGADRPLQFVVRKDDRQSTAGLPNELLPGGPNEFQGVLPPGDYDLDLDLGRREIQRTRIRIEPREVAEVKIRLP